MPLTPVETDPFTLVFDKLWELAEASVPLAALVKPGNRIKFNKEGERGPLKEAVAVADLPELVLTTTGTSAVNSHSSSCGSSITRQYSWLLSTGDYRFNYKLFPVQFALFAAIIDAEYEIQSLQWNGNPFVLRCFWSALTEGLSNAELNRGVKGWSSLWTFQIDMNFSTNDLRLFSKGQGA
jgi:hypothetical protein